MTDLSPEQLRAEVERIRWFDTIDLSNGVVTRGEDESASKLARLESRAAGPPRMALRGARA